jgi:hypothetical protein
MATDARHALRMAVLEALNKIAGSRFAEPGQSGLSPFEFVGSLVTEPVDTVTNTVSGVGDFFDGLASGVRNSGKTQDSALASLTGEAKEKRVLATTYGVDPYTDFKPLADRLDSLARASALGGLAVKGAFVAWGAGLVVECRDRQLAQRKGAR